jgi:hypothetical protein
VYSLGFFQPHSKLIKPQLSPFAASRQQNGWTVQIIGQSCRYDHSLSLAEAKRNHGTGLSAQILEQSLVGGNVVQSGLQSHEVHGIGLSLTPEPEGFSAEESAAP